MSRITSEEANERGLPCKHGHPANWRDDRGAGRIHRVCRSCDADKSRRLHYGLSRLEYESILAKQDGKCAICLTETKLVVDHNHETDIPRGLLCHSCNLAVGAFESSKKRDIEEYLEKYNA